MSVCCIIVTYFPDNATLAKILDVLKPQVAAIIVVDNTTDLPTQDNIRKAALQAGAKLIALKENLGIAAAQNKGLELAKSQGHHYVLLLDHDSIPAKNMVPTLVEAHNRLEQMGHKVAAVGPRYIQVKTGRSSEFIRFGWFGKKRFRCDESNEHNHKTIPVNFLISSGSLISQNALNDVGLMDETYFIDHVDTQWFLRAAAMGYTAFGVCHATMSHNLGDLNCKRIWFGRWRYLANYRPQRYYFIYRNSMRLYREPYAPWLWIWTDIQRLAVIAFFCLVQLDTQAVKMIYRGCIDGLAKKLPK